MIENRQPPFALPLFTNRQTQDNSATMPADTQVTIDRIEMGTGWVCFQAGSKPPSPETLPKYLNHTFYAWLQRNVEFTVRTTLPIVENGNTVAIHVWFD